MLVTFLEKSTQTLNEKLRIPPKILIFACVPSDVGVILLPYGEYWDGE